MSPPQLEPPRIGPARKMVVALLGAACIGGSAWLLYRQFTYGGTIYFRLVIGAGILGFVGAAILWEDFIEPVIARWRGR